MIQDTCTTALYVLCSLSAVLCLHLGYVLRKALREHKQYTLQTHDASITWTVENMTVGLGL